MAYLLSQKLPHVKEEDCIHLPRYWFAGYKNQGECGVTTQNYSLALSPAFIIEGNRLVFALAFQYIILFIICTFPITDYNWSSGEYSTWSESTWSALSSRLFLRPSRTHEIVTLTIGFVVLILSFCLVYIISSRSEILFEDPGPNASTDA